MKRAQKLSCIIFLAALLASCNTASPSPRNLETVTPASVATQVVPTNYPSPISKPSPAPLPTLVFSKISTANNSQTKLNNQCVTETYSLPISNGIIVLRSLKHVVDYQSPDIILIDMSKAQPNETILKTRITSVFAVSGDGKLIAYEASTIKDEKVTQVDLIIANGNFQTQHTIPWDDQWDSILGWTIDHKIIISVFPKKDTNPPASYFLIDPLNGKQKAIPLAISDFLDKSLYDLPYWGGWYGLSINPTVNLVVYPRQSNANKEMYTYALWDIPDNKTILSLENVFSAFSNINRNSLKPSWSIDGTQFAFVGVKEDASSITFELFRVTQDGNIQQLTNLSDVAYIWDSAHSWSSDSANIAFFLSQPQREFENLVNVAVVNTSTLDVTNLCLSIGFHGFTDELTTPIWSPNGAQFLVVDHYEKDHQRVLLVDIEKGIVYPIAYDAEPIGWMVAP